MNTPDNRKPLHHPQTASRIFSGEAVVISPSENMVRMFNLVGSRIWELSDGAHTVDEIVAALVEEYDVDSAQAREGVERFVDDLVGKNLIAFAE